MADNKGDQELDQELSDLLDSAAKDFQQNSSSSQAKPQLKVEDWSKEFLTHFNQASAATNQGSGFGLPLPQDASKLQTPPNSFVDESAFERAMREQMKNLNHVS